MDINLYTELDSLWDTRRMILIHLAREHGRKDFDWNKHFAEVYKQRKYDIFDYPEFGFSEKSYLERYAKRVKEDWSSPFEYFAVPTRLIDNMFQIVRELEFGIGKMLSMSNFNVTVNTWPYKLNDNEILALKEAISGAVKFHIDISLVFVEPEELSASFLHGFHYVFKYNYLTSPDMKKYWETFDRVQSTNTKFIVPAILAKKWTMPEELAKETPLDLISKVNASLGGKVTFIPVDKAIFDYR